MSDEEFKSVVQLDGRARYEYLLKRVADHEAVWSLADQEGWVLMATDEGAALIPIWADSRTAQACVSGAWQGSAPRSIPLTDWIERWLPGMIRDGRQLAVFPTPEDRGVILEPRKFQDDLEVELRKYDDS